MSTPPASILLVDDRPENLVALHEMLAPLGQPVVQACSGEEALRQLLDLDVAVILLDVHMPGIDGFETAALIKQEQRTRHIPIIFLTAIPADLAHILGDYSEGTVDYVAKPVDAWVLRSKVRVLLELHAKNLLLGRQAAELEHRLVEQLRAEAALDDAAVELERRAMALERSNTTLTELAEEAQAASRAKTSFLNMAAHELRTPLTVVIGYLDLVRSGAYGELPERAAAPLATMTEKAQDLGSLIDAILTAARLESGRMETRRQTFDLRDAVNDAVGRSRARAVLFEADLQCIVPADPVPVVADPEQIGRVLDNLVNNALNYGGPEPWVEVEVVGGAPARVRVTDRGIGIPADAQAYIFERFYRGRDPGLGRGGTGLGLYISQELARRNQGRLVLEWSAPERGSTFVLELGGAAMRPEKLVTNASNGSTPAGATDRAVSERRGGSPQRPEQASQ